MAGFQTTNNDHLIRSNLWSTQLKEVLLDELIGTRYVDMITDFPDGDTLNIPSIGQAEVNDYVEGQAIKYTSMDTGNFTFSVDQYKSSATWITEKEKQDSFYMSRLVAGFVPKQARAIAKSMEKKILTVGPSGQTAASLNAINGAAHRWVGQGASNAIAPIDFARANFGLDMANVPHQNRVAILHPSCGYSLQTLTNLTNLSFNPRWEGIVANNNQTGTKFLVNVYGFDVYISQNLPLIGSETVNSVSVTNSVGNIFFSAASDVLPIVGLIRQQPKVDSSYNKDYQRDEYVTTSRYGFKLFRPENMITVLTDSTVAN